MNPMTFAPSIFRMLRLFAWITKGVLLLIAAAVPVLWPMSRRRSLEVWASRYTLQANRVYGLDFGAWCDNGQIAIGRDRKECLNGLPLELARAEAESYHGTWHWQASSDYSHGIQASMTWTHGPFSAWVIDENDSELIWSRRFYSAPCWLVAPTAAAWPLTSVALLSHRRMRRRRRARNGLCQTCGYDLRASSGRCPECGTVPQAKASEKSLAKSQSE